MQRVELVFKPTMDLFCCRCNCNRDLDFLGIDGDKMLKESSFKNKLEGREKDEKDEKEKDGKD